MSKATKRNPWAWIPTLYFAQGIPYFAVNMISVMMFKRLGMSNTDIALYTGWLYLPWVIKPFWSPIVDVLKTKRWWTVVMQIIVALALAGVAFTIPTNGVNVLPDSMTVTNASVSLFSVCLAIFWIMAFASATHDIASDGFYMLALNTHEQSLFVGIRSTFYRCASILGQGGLVALAGYLETSSQNIPQAWITTFACMAIFFGVVAVYHLFILPYPVSDKPHVEEGDQAGVGAILKSFVDSFATFFKKSHVLIAILFMLFYRLPEAQLIKLIQPFLVDPVSAGGLGLSTAQVGIAYGTIGVIGLTVGGIIGGICASAGGLRKWIWPMALCISLNSIVYIYLSAVTPSVDTVVGQIIIYSCVFLDQFGYGFGFTAFMLFMMYFADGPYKTSHYAICTAFMALGMMIPGMIAGAVEEAMGYNGFFWYVLCCTFATWGVTALVYPHIDPNYGRKSSH
ncbi:MAG: MFS transporter [Muribaculaceae bacterium]|nr:MFS transporter [Muribaculaceae bacterium]MDE6321721.1 MFS transporter [Muribaculaceae bacterium]